jgi:tetratricopeptide (TPR) repeat protein
LAVVVVFAIGLVAWWIKPRPDPDKMLQAARRELARGKFAEAEQFAQTAAGLPQASPWALLVAAEAAVKSGRKADALRHYEHVPLESGEASVHGRFGAAEMLCHLGRLSESEVRLREALALDPQHTLAHSRLAFVLNITGRRWAAVPHLLHLVRQQPGDVESLLLLGNSERMVDEQALLAISHQSAPGDPLPMLGQARMELALNQLTEARQHLEPIQRQLPAEAEVQVRWGQVLLDMAATEDFISWNRRLPNTVEEHPEIWVLRGAFAMRRDERRVAVRCFWEALRRDSEHRAAHYKLGQALAELGEHELAAPFLQRAELLQQLTIVLDDLFHHRPHLQLMQRAAGLTERLGRIPESYGWAVAALRQAPDTTWARDVVRRWAPLRPAMLPRTREADNMAANVDLSMFPAPDWSPTSQRAPSHGDSSAQIWPTVRFVDEAAATGLEFRYFNSADPATPGALIFETTGGGVGVLDYDGDGWPDLYFTQGCERSETSEVSKDFGSLVSRDQLFRNESGQQFSNVTTATRLGDPDFSQGVAVGDYDNDGFPDLYVANFGPNRLYRNDGDGTFTEVTREAGLTASLWTTSCLMADLNGDGHPDLYDVNYCMGVEIDSLVCQKQGKWRSCSPRAFDAAPDHVWLNLGDGRFRNVSDECGINVPIGYGLGIVAADFLGNGRLSLFVANDEVPNFFFVNQTARGEPLRLDEQALLAGVAVDGEGASQACMGVAAGDADGDGLLDLYVTNFYNESNTLYRQLAPGQFADDTRRARLRDPSFALLGFGTQFLDGELDGWADLVVTNGHIDDLTDVGQPYQMPPQYLRNLGQGRFVELPARELGPYFDSRYLGRGLARVDWNRDGLDDFVVSHLDAPAALLTNRTRDHGHFLTVQLRGTLGSRDAIGTTVEVTTQGRRHVRQLTAGDGYMASNHRQLTFGLGTASRVDKLSIRWPGGATQEWRDLDVDQALLFIESSSEPQRIK